MKTFKVKPPTTTDGFEIFVPNKPEDMPDGAKGKNLVKIYGIADENGEFFGFPDSVFPGADTRFYKTPEEAESYIVGIAQGINLVFSSVCTSAQKERFGRVGAFAIKSIVIPHEDAKKVMQFSAEADSMSCIKIGGNRGLDAESGSKALRNMKSAVAASMEKQRAEKGTAAFGDAEIAAAEKALLEAIEESKKEENDKEEEEE